MKKCNRTFNANVHPSVRIGGFSMGGCENEVLPGMVVCAWHTTPDAVIMLVAQLTKEIEELTRKVEELSDARSKDSG